jgi:nucleotide-binding universal stress UspA family protein
MSEYTDERLFDFLLGLKSDPELEEAVGREDSLRRRCHALRVDLGSLDQEFGKVLRDTARDSLSRDSWRILLAVDDSPGSRTATLAAAALAARSGGVLEVLHVREVQLGSRGCMPPESMVGAIAVVKAALTELRSRGLAARGQLRCASPGRVAHNIVWEAEEIRADVIVLGSTRRSWLWALAAPRVAARVVRRSCCPVLVVR